MGDVPVCINDFEEPARKSLTRNAYIYYSSGADDQQTLKENQNAFKRLRIRPRILQNVSNIDMSTTVLGKKIDFPICIAPTAMQRMANPEGELATAQVAAEFGTCMILSSWSTCSVEDVSNAAPRGLRWFQLYIYKDRNVVIDLVKRAEKAGYQALAVTVDTPILGQRRNDVRHKFALPSEFSLANYKKDDSHSEGVHSDKDSGLAAYVKNLIDPSLSWKDIDWLRTITSLPILLKGVLTKEAAIEAVKHGIDGIIVSNHGARQLDGVTSTIEALPEVVSAVNGKVEVFLDGGVRLGTDAFKALALGAKAVFIGRPILWGLAYNGKEGVKQVLGIMRNEFERCMTLSGCRNVQEIDRSMVAHESQYSKL